MPTGRLSRRRARGRASRLQRQGGRRPFPEGNGHDVAGGKRRLHSNTNLEPGRWGRVKQADRRRRETVFITSQFVEDAIGAPAGQARYRVTTSSFRLGKLQYAEARRFGLEKSLSYNSCR